MDRKTKCAICDAVKLSSYLLAGVSMANIVNCATPVPNRLGKIIIRAATNCVVVMGSSWIISEGMEHCARACLGLTQFERIMKDLDS